jgi:5'-nucleotidase
VTDTDLEVAPNEARRATRHQGPPLILITNDDGVRARGIEALARAAVEAQLGDVYVVAPDRDNSGISHALTLHEPLRVLDVRPGWMAVTGTPTDCVYLAAVEVLPRWPSLILSGVNAGANLSFDVHYSGTVSAAIEGTILGIPSVAVSLVHPRRGDFDLAARFGAELGRWVLDRGGLPPGVTLNVNVPEGQPTTWQRTFLGRRPYSHAVHVRHDPRGRPYYWIGGDPAAHDDLPGSDCNAIHEGMVSVTPLEVDLTEPRLEALLDGGVRVGGFGLVPSVDPPVGFRLAGADSTR